MNTDLKMLKTCMLLSQKAYNGRYGKPVIEGLKCEKWFKLSNVEFFVCWIGKKFFVVFEGSNGAKDWLDNFKFWQTLKVNGRKYHKGHFTQYLKVQYILIEIIAKALSKNPEKIYFTGHSLGGSLASITVSSFSELFKNNKNKFACYTYGSSRNMSYKAKKFFDRNIKESVRCVNGEDAVAKLPFKTFPGLFYFHVKDMLHVGKKMKWYKFLTGPISFIKGSIKDHYPQEYISGIEYFVKSNLK